MKRQLKKIAQKGNSVFYTLSPLAYARGRHKSFPKPSAQIYGEGDFGTIPTGTLKIDGKVYTYVKYGGDDNQPANIRKLFTQNMVTSQCLAFDIQACYGQGVRFVNRDSERKDTDNPDIREFCLANSLHECFMEQATDMKFYYFNVCEIILNRDPDPDKRRIMRIHHLESCYTRFELADKSGNINHVFYGSFGETFGPTDAVAIPLLDPIDPLGDLNRRTGRVEGYKPTNECRFAVVSRMPTPGYRYYPIPYSWSIFADKWYDIYNLISEGKKNLIKNTSAPRWLIEIHQDYFQNLCTNEFISDPEKRAERIKKEQQNIVDFVCGVENAGKALISNYYVDADGHQQSAVKITNLQSGSKKEGGDWTEDMEEASNSLCFALGVHPNLIGATPGKSQMNNSGSDKRELFTLKQAMERPFHDVMLKPYHLILHFNGWADRFTVDVPMIELTTLDKNTSAQKATIGNNGNEENFFREVYNELHNS